MDAVLFAVFAQTIAMENRMGWAWFSDQRYIVFCLLCVVAYFLLSISKSGILGKFGVVTIFILVTVAGVSVSLMQYRARTNVEQAINDAGLQDEIAGKMLILGKNPYTETYENSPLALAPYGDEEKDSINPALFYYAHPPTVPIITAISYRLMAPRFHWYDIRLTLIGCFLALLILGFLKWGLSETYLMYLIAVGCNPYFIRSVIEGSNDIVSILFFTGAILFLEKKKILLAGILYGLSLGAKQIIWPSVPFVMLAVWNMGNKRNWGKFLLASGLTVLLIYLPFIVWDWQGLYNGLIAFHGGSLPHSYPIHNIGFGMMLLQMGVVKNIHEYYNFALWQAGGILVVFAVMVKLIKKVPMAVFILSGWVGCLVIIFLFNRALNFSYLGIMQVGVALVVLWADKNLLKGKKYDL